MPQDIEAQKHTAAPLRVSDTSAPTYSRGGRGGAGNFKDQAAAAESLKLEREEAEKTKAAVAAAAQASKARVGLSGRGGVGNWSDNGTPLGAVLQQQEQQKVEDLELKVLKDVEAGLAMPAPAYCQPERERDL
jgi:hypothetical protein